MTAQLQLDLNCTFRLADAYGAEVVLKSERLRAMVAVLATSKDYRRPRKILQDMLWHRSPEEQASSSLRTALSMLRKALGAHCDLLGSDRTYVWLAGIELAPRRALNGGFFEDAPHLGELFEDWLSWERAYQKSKSLPTDGEPAPPAARPNVLLCQPRIVSDDPYTGFIIQIVCDQLVHSLRLQGFVDVFDLRDLESDQLSSLGMVSVPRANYALQSELTKSGQEACLSLTVCDPATRRVIWNRSLYSEPANKALFTRLHLEEFSNTAADAILIALMRDADTSGAPSARPPQSLLGAVHQILGMSLQGQDSARAILRKHIDEQNNSVAMAWYAFSIANTIGEGNPAPDLIDSADELCRRALEADPTNGMTLALTAHVYGFVLRRLNLGRELAARARQVAPHLALAWDLSAMNAIYLGHSSEALRFSRNAQRLGQFSPYRSLFDSSLTIAASVAGDVALGTRTASSVLAQRPNFLAVMRYQFGNLAAAGRIDEAGKLLRRIRERDQRFFPGEIAAPDYPLPSVQARDLVQNAFKLVGPSF